VFFLVLWIRTGFSADPEPALYLNADQDPGSPTNVDPDPGQTLKSQKAEFLHEKFRYVGRYVGKAENQVYLFIWSISMPSFQPLRGDSASISVGILTFLQL
jgi:hypothetical protein